MNIADSNVFIPCNCILEVELKNRYIEEYEIDINIPVKTYYQLLCYIDLLNKADSQQEQITYFINASKLILKQADKKINTNWIIDNISPDNQFKMIEEIINAIAEMLQDSCLILPDIEPAQKAAKTEYEKDRRKIQEQINRYNSTLKSRTKINLMDEVAFLTTKTSNSYKDIMDMPILVFKDLIKTVILQELRTDDDYNLAYLKNECEEFKIELNNGKADVKPEPKGADTAKLKYLLSL